MDTLSRRALLLGTPTALALAAAGRADDKKDPKDADEPTIGEKSESALAVEALETANGLAQFGRRTKTAKALATAALVIAKTPQAAVDLPKDKQDGVELAEFDPSAEAKVLLDEATKLAPKNKAVEDMAATVAELLKEAKRGAVGGATSITARILPGKTYTRTKHFEGNSKKLLFTVTLTGPAPTGFYLVPPTWMKAYLTQGPKNDRITAVQSSGDFIKFERWPYKADTFGVVVTNVYSKTITVTVHNN